VADHNHKKTAQEVLPGPIRTAEDLFKVPDHIKRRIQRQLELEEMEEFLRARGES
jgi:Glu-tRNA(Gln) amidotransferase subunit E-like FAD-binding protein